MFLFVVVVVLMFFLIYFVFAHYRLTSGSIDSEEDFNMANGDVSSSDSSPSVTNRPALQQFKRQKEQAAVEGIINY